MDSFCEIHPNISNILYLCVWNRSEPYWTLPWPSQASLPRAASSRPSSHTSRSRDRSPAPPGSGTGTLSSRSSPASGPGLPPAAEPSQGPERPVCGWVTQQPPRTRRGWRRRFPAGGSGREPGSSSQTWSRQPKPHGDAGPRHWEQDLRETHEENKTHLY